LQAAQRRGFIPYKGPLAEQNLTPVYVAKLSDVLNSGSFKVILGNGEAGNGRWSVIPHKLALLATFVCIPAA